MKTAGDVREQIRQALKDLHDKAIDLSLDLHRHPELSMREEYAAGRLKAWLAAEGFEVESPVAGLDTAFVARVGNGDRPRVAYLLEYDALPEIGHACGHNLIAAGGLAAATALHRALPDPDGTLLVIGTPGEEGGGGKITELDAGVFEGVDAALMFHPGDRTWPWRHATAIAHLSVKFHGKAAHAAGNPGAGRNALSAMLQFFSSVDALRQHVPESARLHGVITHGGAAPNIIPDYTEAAYLVRALTQEGTHELVERVTACAEGAARATGTTTEVSHESPLYAERKNNKVIASRVAEYLRGTGEDVQEPVLKGGTGSSDIGNVSLVLPSIHPYMQIVPRGTPGHSVAFRDAAGSPEGLEAMTRMAEALALAGADLLLDPEMVERAWEEFRTTGADVPD
ncbi:MAG: amidohydrolase [Streptosporangiales bacterium]